MRLSASVCMTMLLIKFCLLIVILSVNVYLSSTNTTSWYVFSFHHHSHQRDDRLWGENWNYSFVVICVCHICVYESRIPRRRERKMVKDGHKRQIVEEKREKEPLGKNNLITFVDHCHHPRLRQTQQWPSLDGQLSFQNDTLQWYAFSPSLSPLDFLCLSLPPFFSVTKKKVSSGSLGTNVTVVWVFDEERQQREITGIFLSKDEKREKHYNHTRHSTKDETVAILVLNSLLAIGFLYASPGTVEQISFSLLPPSLLIKKGHSVPKNRHE